MSKILVNRVHKNNGQVDSLLLVTTLLTYGNISEVATDDSSLSFHRRADFRMDSTQYYILKRTAHKYKYLKKGASHLRFIFTEHWTRITW